MIKILVTTATLFTACIIAGCGSSGSSMMTTPTSTAKSVIAGTVADGYLVGATVFLDKNGNYQLDAGEPSTTTDQNGAYTLNIDPADVGKYPIVAIATKGVTVDKDTGAAVASSYVLSLPKDSVTGTVSSNFISPMSSLIRETMAANPGMSLTDAMVLLRSQMNLPAGMNMLSDYVSQGSANSTDPNKANYQAMHAAARNMATLMGSQMGQVLATNGSTTTVDVGRYQGMMVSIFKNMSTIKGSNPNSPAMTNMAGTMTTTLQGTSWGLPFRNISTSIRGMMGRSGSSTIGGMMGGAGLTAAGGMM